MQGGPWLLRISLLWIFKRYPTLLLNEGIPRALKGKKLCLKNPKKLASESEGIYLQILMESTCKK